MLWPGMMSGMYEFSMYPPKSPEVWPASRRFSERVGEAFLEAEIWGATDLRIFSRKWWVFICVLEMFWSFFWYLILEMENHHHHHPPKEMVSKLCHGQAPATRLKRHCLCCLSVVSSAGYRPVMFCWASGRSLDNSVCGTWKILEKIRFTSGFWKFGIWNSTSSVLTQTAIASRSHNNGFRSFERFTRGLSSQNWDQIICCDTFAQTVFLRSILCAHVSCSVFQVNMWSQNVLIGQQIKLRIKVKIMVIIIIIIILLLPPAPRPRHHQQRHIVHIGPSDLAGHEFGPGILSEVAGCLWCLPTGAAAAAARLLRCRRGGSGSGCFTGGSRAVSVAKMMVLWLNNTKLGS